MKFTKIAIAALIITLACTSATAQTKATAAAPKTNPSQYDVTSETTYRKKLEDIKKEIEEKQKAIKDLAAKAPKGTTQPGSINFQPLMDEIPAPVGDLKEASKPESMVKYDPYILKIEKAGKELLELSQKQNKYDKIYQEEGQAGLEKRAKEQSDKSAFVAQMGGTDKIMQMSEAERKAAAMQVASNMRQNPGGMSGNPAMGAFAQKYQSDPAFAARWNKMSDAEKQVELKKIMAANPSTPSEPFDQQKHQQQVDKRMEEKNNAQKKIAFDLLVQRTQQKLMDASDRQIKIGKEIEDVITEMKAKLRTRFDAIAEAIPEIEMGEYGHGKDPVQLRSLEIQMAYSYHFVDMAEAGLRDNAWRLLKADCMYATGEMNDFISNYKWGSDKGEVFGSYNEANVAAAAQSPYNMMIELAKSAKAQTDYNQKQQKIFIDTINKN